MSNLLAEIGIETWDFIGISAYFLLTMLFFFSSIKNGKHFWLNYVMLVTFFLQCLFVILFRGGLPVKFFAASMLATVLIVEGVTNRKKKMESV